MTSHCIRSALLAFLLGLLLPACRSIGEPGSASLASVRIDGFTRARIQTVTRDVFTTAGYTVVSAAPQEMVFQRPGTLGDRLKYGGWLESGVVMRVKVRFSYVGQGADLLEADVRAVRGAGSPYVEDDNPVLLPGRKNYQHLLDEVRQRLTGK